MAVLERLRKGHVVDIPSPGREELITFEQAASEEIQDLALSMGIYQLLEVPDVWPGWPGLPSSLGGCSPQLASSCDKPVVLDQIVPDRKDDFAVSKM